MGSMLIVAKKEFRDLLNSKLVLIILAFYMIMLLTSLYITYTNGATTSKGFILMEPGYDASYLGSLVAIVLGFSSMSVETSGKALNTLLVKPVYRDTIINGKLLGVLAFLSWIFWITVAVYTLVLYLIDGNLISAYILLYVERLPFMFLLYLLCCMLFYSLSMLMSIMFKEQSFALFMGLLSWIILIYMMNDVVIVQNIASSLHTLFGGEYFHITEILSPILMVRAILLGDDAISTITGGDLSSVGAWLSSVSIKFAVFTLYCFITIILAYVAFLRRDVV